MPMTNHSSMHVISPNRKLTTDETRVLAKTFTFLVAEHTDVNFVNGESRVTTQILEEKTSSSLLTFLIPKSD